MIAVVDYRLGNAASILNMLAKLGIEARLTADPRDISLARGLILPGVGAFDAGMCNLEASGLVDVLRRRVSEDRIPFLGICLGLQLLCRNSEEGRRPGLGWLRADCVRLRLDTPELKLPHMGWREVAARGDSPLLRSLGENPRFYFVHSFHLACDNPAEVVAVASYGREFPAVVASGNILGTQFHPEKSHRWGMAILRNFGRMTGTIA